jgi:peptidoglycan/LPS O-acetylase OafA/YrhL
MDNKPVYFKSLDSLRTISFLLVLISHCFTSEFSSAFLKSENKLLDSILTSIFHSGGEGVSIFFVLSGFLITHLLIAEEQKNKSISLFNFYVRRSLRIWPLYFIVMIFGLFIYPIFELSSGRNELEHVSTFLNLTFLNNFDLLSLISQGNQGFNPQIQIAWSVAIEEQFYLIWPLFFLLVKSQKRLLLMFTILVISITFRIFNYYNYDINYFHTLAVCGDMIIGGIFATAINYNSKVLHFFKSNSNKSRLIFYIIAICFFLLRHFIFNFEKDIAILRYLMLFLYAFIICDQCFNTNNFFKLERFKIFSSLGKYTYSMYLIHMIVILMLKNIFDYLLISYKTDLISGIWLAFLTLILTIFVSFLSYNYFEIYFLKLKTKFSKI